MKLDFPVLRVIRDCVLSVGKTDAGKKYNELFPKYRKKILSGKVYLASPTFIDNAIKNSKALGNLLNDKEVQQSILDMSGVYIMNGWTIAFCDGGSTSFIYGGKEGHVIAIATPLNIWFDPTPGNEEEANNIVEDLRAILVLLLLMEKYAKVEKKVIMPKEAVRLNPKLLESSRNMTEFPINYRTSTWFTTICRDEEFGVSGHFRLQPKKVNGEWTKELIYIQPYVKHGYHRTAGILQEP